MCVRDCEIVVYHLCLLGSHANNLTNCWIRKSDTKQYAVLKTTHRKHKTKHTQSEQYGV
jgi:nickel-dependent lactate racemase